MKQLFTITLLSAMTASVYGQVCTVQTFTVGNAQAYGSNQNPTPVPGSKPDHTPDYDVFSDSGLNTEVSASSNSSPIQDVIAGSTTWHRLETVTSNRDVEPSDYRSGNPQSIDGELNCRVLGITLYDEVDGSEEDLEYDTDNLEVNNYQEETIAVVVPNYPGNIWECYTNVDDDDEIVEESESNNRSRTERFNIVAPNIPQASPCPGLDYDTCMAAIMVILD